MLWVYIFPPKKQQTSIKPLSLHILHLVTVISDFMNENIPYKYENEWCGIGIYLAHSVHPFRTFMKHSAVLMSFLHYQGLIYAIDVTKMFWKEVNNMQ